MTNKKQKGTILIVDDMPDNIHLLSEMLSERGYNIRAVKTSREAIDSANNELPDLILLDIMMPDISGYEVCKTLKDNDKTNSIPVIFLSALNESKNILQGFAVGGVDFISKPFNEEEVIARVKTQIEISSLRFQLEKLTEELKLKNDSLLEEVNKQKHSTSVLEKSIKNLKDNRNATLNILEDLKAEVEERKESEEALLASETRYRRLFESAKDGILILNAETGMINDVNPFPD